MPPLHVRRLNIDLSKGFPRHWLGGDAFRTQMFNAQSMTFPIGEQYFIDSVREALPLVTDPGLREQVKAFIGQEAAHRHLHAQYNEQLALQGFPCVIEPFIAWRIRVSQGLSPKDKVAVTMAYEHFTAILADGVLRHPTWLEGAAEPLKTLWSWHAVEETEHKSIAFDVYHALGGGYVRRIGWYLYVVLVLGLDTTVQTTHCLYRDGQLFKPRTWLSALRVFFGRQGLAWHTLPQIATYFRPGFTPWQHDNLALATQWLNDQPDAFREAGRTP